MKTSNKSRYNSTLFNFWIELNYNVIAQALSDKGTLAQDAFHDALIDTYHEVENLQQVTIEDISTIFNVCYKKSSKRSITINFRYIPFEDNILEFIINQNYVIEEDVKRVDYEHVVAAIKEVLTTEEYRLLTLYVWVEGMSYSKLSAYTGIPESTLYKQIKSIKAQAVKNLTI